MNSWKISEAAGRNIPHSNSRCRRVALPPEAQREGPSCLSAPRDSSVAWLEATSLRPVPPSSSRGFLLASLRVVFPLCMSGTGRGSCRTSPSGFSAVFPMIALRDAPCSSDHIGVPAVPWLLTADIDVDLLARVLFRLLPWEVKPHPTQPTPALSEGVALSSQRGGMGVS